MKLILMKNILNKINPMDFIHGYLNSTTSWSPKKEIYEEDFNR